jgi:hypothetical protein
LTFRKRWPNWWNYLPNDAVKYMTQHPPTTIHALAVIPGIGESKANNIGKQVLATLYAFFEQHDLLHLFPGLPKPTIDPCPTWQDPLSEAAEKARAELAALAGLRPIAATRSEPVAAVESRTGGSTSNLGVANVLPPANPYTQMSASNPYTQAAAASSPAFDTSKGYVSHTKSNQRADGIPKGQQYLPYKPVDENIGGKVVQGSPWLTASSGRDSTSSNSSGDGSGRKVSHPYGGAYHIPSAAGKRPFPYQVTELEASKKGSPEDSTRLASNAQPRTFDYLID